MKRDQRGFTIVELLIAVAILSIVVAAVCGFILVGSRSYAAGNSDISVQQEAQLALNQMSDVMIDTTRSVNYVGYDAGGNAVHVLKDAEFTFTPEEKSLIMFNGVVEGDPDDASTQTVAAGNGNKHYHFYWSKADETLYYTELNVDPANDVDTKNIHFPAFDPTDPDWVVLAGHVTDFSVDLSQVEEKRVVQLALTFLDGRKEYVTSNNVTIRNKVGVNDAELSPLNKKKTLSVTPRDSGVIIEPGETYHFSTPKVTGENVADRSVRWSVESPVKPGTDFIDKANGILKVAEDEPAGTIKVAVTTNAVDSNGDQASCPVEVKIKRVREVNLSPNPNEGTDPNENDTVYLVSAGSTYIINADVQGNELGKVCSVCGDPTDIDKSVVWEPVDDPNHYLTMGGSDEHSLEVAIASNTPEGEKFRIRATSILSTQGNGHGREYHDKPVQREIILKVAKGNEDAEPYGGNLKYGEQTLKEVVRDGLSTDHPKYVTAIRVVDNSGKEPDKVLLHFSIGGGANYRICPDLFDLDLNGSYTFYLQALDPVSAENRKLYQEGKTGQVIEDDADAIREEYFSHLNTSKPYGYVGTKYPHGKVFYAKLDKPKLTYEYNNVEYTGKNITYDPVNIYAVGLGSGIVGEIRPTKYENIVDDNSAWNYISNSLYEGKGNDQSQWNKLYYVNEDSIVDKKSIENNQSLKYWGSDKLADGSVEINPKGSMFMKLNDSNNLLKACGDYHIVPGMVYQNKDPGTYEIIGWQGFDFDHLPREVHYYEFDDSTIHVNVNAEFTMDVNHDKFKGKLAFPLPKEMKKSSMFPNIESMDWQTSAGSLTVAALNEWSNGYNMTITYVRYHYIKSDNAWEVEPYIEEYDAGAKKMRTYCYGRYKCRENDTKWTWLHSVASTERELVCNLNGVMVNGKSYNMYFPLPSENSFPFRGGTTKIDCTSSHVLFDEAGNADLYWLMNNARIKYEHIGNIHRITFVNKYYEPQEFCTFECTDGATSWIKVK